MRYALAAVLAVFAGFRACADEPRTVSLEGEIDDAAVQRVGKALAGARAGAPVTVYIDSPGGSFFAGLRMIHLFERSKVNTTCEVGGLAASMAAIILESPACRRRVVRPWSVLMFHGVAVEEMTRFYERDARELLAMLVTANRSVALLVAPRLKISEQEYLARTATAWWLVGRDAGPAADEVRP